VKDPRIGVGVALAILWAPLTAAAASTYYVAPAGSDSAAGTMAAPWATVGHAQEMAAAGDTIYIRGGQYTYTKGTTTCTSTTATINGIPLNKSGSSGNPIRYWAYPGETPIFDFYGIKDSCRVTGFRVTGSWIHLKGLEVRGVPQNNMDNHESWGVWNSGSNNTFELLDLHHNMGPGLFIQNGSNNLVLNCDSHHNYDPMTSNGAGQSADGFGAHVSANNNGNVFRGCRAWWNTDDNYDLINAFSVVTIENSWGWYAGYLPDTMTSPAAGNGNGFKAGGYGTDTSTFPANPPRHVIRNCLSISNKAAAFYANHHPGQIIFHNNTGYNSHPDFNLLGMDGSGADIHVGILRNNLAFGGTLVSNDSGTDAMVNSWMLSSVTVSAADFQSTSITGLDGPRQADGSLPAIPNFHLAAGSDLIDKGVDVGLPYVGAAPDLGAFEVGASTTGAGGSGGSTAGAGGAAGLGGSTAGRGGTTGAAGRGGATAAAGSGGMAAGRGGTVGGGGTPGAGGASGAAGGALGAAGSTSAGATGTTGVAGASPTGAAGSSQPAGAAGAPGEDAAGGCSCESAGGGPAPAPLVSLLILTGVAMTRRRRGATEARRFVRRD
jgi:MYXO-CTERM domain-containing protein